MLFLVFLISLGCVSSFLQSGLRSSNTFLSPLNCRGSTAKYSEEKEVGGVYEYRSDDGAPPPELAALFGLSSSTTEKKPRKTKTKINSATTTTGDSVTTTFTQNEYIPRDTREAKKKKNERERRLERRERKDAKLNGKPAKAKVAEEIPMDKLELQLLSKYGANTYREALEDYEEEESARKGNTKKFGGFMSNKESATQPLTDRDIEQAEANEARFYEGSTTMSADTGNAYGTRDARPPTRVREGRRGEREHPVKTSVFAKLKSKRLSTPVEGKKRGGAIQSVEDYFNDDDDDTPSPSLAISKKSGGEGESHDAWNAYESDMDYDRDAFSDDNDENERRSGPLNAVHGFRLRPIAPISAEEQAKIDAKNARLKEKEEAKMERRKAKRVAEKNEFAQFTFRDTTTGVDATVPTTGADSIFSTSSWAEIGVTNSVVLENLRKMKIFSPTKIQALAIPRLDNNEDVLLQAQTGCGKTLAFLLPLLNIIDTSATKTNIHRNRVQCIILAPSRELVMQIGNVANQVFKDTDIRCETIIGGANVRNQVDRLREYKPSIIVATPGRLAEIIFRLEKLKLSSVRAVIVDEVDNMLREPYLGEMESILENVPAFKRNLEDESEKLLQPRYLQKKDDNNDITSTGSSTSDDDSEGEGENNDGGDAPTAKYGEHKCMLCLASATTADKDSAIQSFSRKFGLLDLKRVAVELDSQLPSGITHALISTPRIRAIDFLKKVLNSKPEVTRALIFVNDPHRVEVLVDQLYDQNIIAAPLHGDSSKEDRREILERVRDGRLQLVVTTELAARGLDIPELSHVINFELPTDAAHYVHRAGRCGRAGRQGLVVNFANPSTKFVVRRFGKQLGAKVLDCEIRDGNIYLKQR